MTLPEQIHPDSWQNYRYIDLHCHSNHSDGSDSPAQLLRLADELRLRAIALTDHDTVSGLPEFFAAASAYPETEPIAGVELSVGYGARELHIVGLFIDPEEKSLQAFLLQQRRNRIRRNEEMGRKLKSLGYFFAWDDPVFSKVSFDNIGRPHIAAVLQKHYRFGSRQEVFDKLLGHGRPAFVRRQLPEPAEAIAAIRQSGGVAVWAHPTYRGRNERSTVKRLAQKLRAVGLEGIEAYYAMLGKAETDLVLEIAELVGLAPSGGSDYHGENAAGPMLGCGCGGLRVPAELLDELKRRRPAR